MRQNKSAAAWYGLLTLSFMLPSFAIAWPRLIVDNAEFNAGVINEGDATFIRHVFELKNVGDSSLVLSKIRPFCDCVSFTCDTIIPPGNSGRFAMLVDLRGITETSFLAFVIISTTDPVFRRIKIGIRGTLNFIIRADPHSVVLPGADEGDTTRDVTLMTGKKDLHVFEVHFSNDNPRLEWLRSIPVRYSFSPAGTDPQSGSYRYTVTIFHPRTTRETMYGRFIFKTDHPDRPELSISGVIDPLSSQ